MRAKIPPKDQEALTDSPLPDRIEDVGHLEDVMTTPSPALVDDLAALEGDILVAGVAGKMGPTLARLARRAAPGKRVFGVARFSDPAVRSSLEECGVECLPVDLLDRSAVARLPEVANVVFMAGRKFGSTGSEDLTWAVNVLVPALVAERYADARLVAFSTACVYPFVPVVAGGARETTPTTPPPGEYAASCVGRERVLRYLSRVHHTPGRLLRLSYAIDMRYGVLHDLATSILAGRAIDLTTGHVNVVWQGDANEAALRALARCTTPTSALNVSGPEIQSVRSLAERLGAHLGRAPTFTGEEAEDAWVVDCAEMVRSLGRPRVPIECLIAWQADWLQRGLPSLGRDTHFEVRDGRF
jgi:nucleoside-diphosphate-sugar epimerase